MLTLFDHCALGRRDFLRVGGLTLGGLSLPSLLQAKAADGSRSQVVKDKSVVFLFLHGGPSQTETFDPKMQAPSNVRSATGEVSTTIPGITFGGTFPKLASLARKLVIVRSFVSGDGNHDIKPIVCRDSFHANIGSLYSRVAGMNDPHSGVPKNVALFPRAVDDSTQQEVRSFGNFTSTGALGSACAPFVPGGGGNLQEDLQINLPVDRIGDRRGLLQQLDQIQWQLDAASTHADKLRDQAMRTILSGAADAFRLDQEHPRVIARYDTSRIARPDNIRRKWNNYDNYVDNGKTLGKLLLLARRLCERGCGFVTVTTNFVWDMHSDVNNAPVEEGMQYMGWPLDHALSAFIEDCESRGLGDKILLVCCGEMGRTPRINANGGRDHWGELAPLLLYGAGLNAGQVVGESDREAGKPTSDPVRIPNLIGTIMHTLFDVGQLRLVAGLPREVIAAASYEPIGGIYSR
jgi:uncharacterized protein (DUF1501 family)